MKIEESSSISDTKMLKTFTELTMINVENQGTNTPILMMFHKRYDVTVDRSVSNIPTSQRISVHKLTLKRKSLDHVVLKYAIYIML